MLKGKKSLQKTVGEKKQEILEKEQEKVPADITNKEEPEKNNV